MIILLLIGSYFLGNILTGSIVSKLFYREEIRTKGSGNPGARNAGRLYGKKAFVITFLGDALKGALVIIIVKVLGFDENIELFALLAVIVGHTYPILFKFRGGKGISTFIGGLLIFDSIVLAVLIGVFLIFFPIVKNFTIAGMGAILSVPIILLLFSYNNTAVGLACLVCGVLLFAHLENIKGLSLRRKERNE